MPCAVQNHTHGAFLCRFPVLSASFLRVERYFTRAPNPPAAAAIDKPAANVYNKESSYYSPTGEA